MKRISKQFLALLLLFSLAFAATANAATPSSVSLAAQQTKYGNTWKNQQTPGWSAYECQGFAVAMKYETSGRAVSTWQRIYTTNNLDDIKAGDIIRYTVSSGSTTNLHSIFIISVSSDGTIKYADANGTSTYNQIRWSTTMSSTLKTRIVQSINNEGTNANPTYIWR